MLKRHYQAHHPPSLLVQLVKKDQDGSQSQGLDDKKCGHAFFSLKVDRVKIDKGIGIQEDIELDDASERRYYTPLILCHLVYSVAPFLSSAKPRPEELMIRVYHFQKRD